MQLRINSQGRETPVADAATMVGSYLAKQPCNSGAKEQKQSATYLVVT